MNVMQPQQGTVNIYDLKYPCYVAAIPNDSTRIVHVPGEFEFQHLDEIFDWVIEAYRTKDCLYIFDAMPRKLWQKGVCNIPYEKRLKYVRTLVTGVISSFDKVMDLWTVLIDNPVEFKDYCDNLRDGSYKRIRIMDSDGFYVFGECENNEYMEMDL